MKKIKQLMILIFVTDMMPIRKTASDGQVTYEDQPDGLKKVQKTVKVKRNKGLINETEVDFVYEDYETNPEIFDETKLEAGKAGHPTRKIYYEVDGKPMMFEDGVHTEQEDQSKVHGNLNDARYLTQQKEMSELKGTVDELLSEIKKQRKQNEKLVKQMIKKNSGQKEHDKEQKQINSEENKK